MAPIYKYESIMFYLFRKCVQKLLRQKLFSNFLINQVNRQHFDYVKVNTILMGFECFSRLLTGIEITIHP